jgi:hypothetical protein
VRRLHLTYANVTATLALVLALGGVGYAAVSLPPGSVGTKQLKADAVTAPKVRNHTLRLHHLGGKVRNGTSTLSSAINLPAYGCGGAGLNLFNPAPKHVIGSLVVGHITDANGDAAMPNSGIVLPTMMSETSQGGVIANLVICTRAGSTLTIPAGSVFHYQLIGP